MDLPTRDKPPAPAPHRDARTDQALRAIEQREFERGIELLGAEPKADAGAESHALLALAHFQLEQYELAARAYAEALRAAPTDARASDWREMQALAEANATSGVDVHVPDLAYFDRDALLARPVLRAGALPEPLPPSPAQRRLLRARKETGEVLGAVCSVIVTLATRLYGRLAGYRDAVWTNWYQRPQFLAILTLAYMRERLNARNLGTSYPPGRLVGFQPSGQSPPLGVSHFRTADGSWNNLADPKEGAAGTRFLRNVEMASIRPESGEPLLSPNPREISRRLLSRPLGADGRPVMQEVPFLNLLAAAWIQFMNGDWINHGEIYFNDVIEVPLPEDDIARTRYWQTKMFIGRSQRDPTRSDGVEVAAASAINEVIQNLWWAVGYNTIAFPLAAGVLYPFVLSPEVACRCVPAATCAAPARGGRRTRR